MGGSPAALLAERVDPSARESLRAVQANGLCFLTPRLPGRFRAAFTTRLGGASRDSYSSLNLAFHTGDRPSLVEENRRRLAGILMTEEGGRSSLEIVSPRQEHSPRVVGAAEYRSAAAASPCDGLTLQPGLDEGLAGLLLFADCLPVLLLGEIDMAIVHAGWRGLLGGVVQQAARGMTGPPGGAFIGPGIGPCCYAVDERLAASFQSRYGEGLYVEGRLDLWEAAGRALIEVGVPPSNVINPRLCTSCNNDLFYSHRREGAAAGRHGLLAWLAGDA